MDRPYGYTLVVRMVLLFGGVTMLTESVNIFSVTESLYVQILFGVLNTVAYSIVIYLYRKARSVDTKEEGQKLVENVSVVFLSLMLYIVVLYRSVLGYSLLDYIDSDYRFLYLTYAFVVLDALSEISRRTEEESNGSRASQRNNADNWEIMTEEMVE